MNATVQPEVGQEIVSAEPQKSKSLAVQLKEKEGNFAAALPAHIPVERYLRVVLTAVQNNPALAKADRPSFWNACMKAAQDGLLPDGREGALVIYNTNVKGSWIAKVSWMPMIAGIRKKVRNSGEIATMDVQAVHAKDAFEFELGDDPFIKHRPFIGGDRGPLVAVYSVVTLKSGEKTRDVMTRSEVEYVRDTYSKRDREGKLSPAWVKSFDEMAKKTVFRRHSKTLPMSTDLDDLLRRDDDLYDMEGRSDKQVAGPAPKSLSDRLDMLAGAPIDHDAETGEVIEGETRDESEQGFGGEQPEIAAGDQDQAPAADKGAGAPATSPAASAPDTAKSTQPAPKEAPHANSGRAAASSQAADGPRKQTAEARRATILADLTAQGDARAADGSRAFDDWLDGLTGDEMALISAAQVKAWKNEAARAAA